MNFERVTKFSCNILYLFTDKDPHAILALMSLPIKDKSLAMPLGTSGFPALPLAYRFRDQPMGSLGFVLAGANLSRDVAIHLITHTKVPREYVSIPVSATLATWPSYWRATDVAGSEITYLHMRSATQIVIL